MYPNDKSNKSIITRTDLYFLTCFSLRHTVDNNMYVSLYRIIIKFTE